MPETRIAGKYDEKLKIISTIGAKEFPYLVADILYFVHQHTEIRVVDGPGDGRRDIHSFNRDGLSHVTQCKFHEDFTTTASSRDTDEIAIALLKFNSEIGLFATNGRISPQGKREYLDNFKKSKVTYLDGGDIVDVVLANPTLSYLWLKNESLVYTRHYISIPVAVKFLKKEPKQTAILIVNGIIEDVTISIASNYIEVQSMGNFQEFETTHSRFSYRFFPGIEFLCEGAVYLHSIDAIKKVLIEMMAKSPSLNNTAVRFGSSYISSMKKSDEIERLKVSGDEPETFRIANRKYVTERDWLLPSDKNTSWIFPKNITSLDAEWSGWYNKENDCCLKVFVNVKNCKNYINDMFANHKRKHILDSLFIKVPADKYENVNRLPIAPNWSCNYGYGGKLYGWLNPLVGLESYSMDHLGNPTRKEDIDNVSEFNNEKKSLLPFLKREKLDQISPADALLISKVENGSLFEEVEYTYFFGAQIYHYIEGIPSPIDTNGRYFNLITYWEIPGQLEKVRKKLEGMASKKRVGPNFYHWEIKNAPRMKLPYLLLTVVLKNDPIIDTDTYLKKYQQTAFEIIAQFENELKGLFPKCKRATQKFFYNEVGLDLYNARSINPNIIFEKKQNA